MSAVGATQQHPDMYPVDTALRSTLFAAVCSTQCYTKCTTVDPAVEPTKCHSLRLSDDSTYYAAQRKA